MQGDIARIGAVKKTEVDKNSNNVVTSETRPNYMQDALLYTPSGVDAPPLPKDRVVLVRTEGTGKFIIVGYLGETREAKPGEIFLYSRDDGRKTKAILKLEKDGKIDVFAPDAISVETEKTTTHKSKEDIDISVNDSVTVVMGKDGTITVKAPSGIKIETPNISVTGNITAGGDVTAGGISLQSHTHAGVHGETSPAH